MLYRFQRSAFVQFSIVDKTVSTKLMPVPTIPVLRIPLHVMLCSGHLITHVSASKVIKEILLMKVVVNISFAVLLVLYGAL